MILGDPSREGGVAAKSKRFKLQRRRRHFPSLTFIIASAAANAVAATDVVRMYRIRQGEVRHRGGIVVGIVGGGV